MLNYEKRLSPIQNFIKYCLSFGHEIDRNIAQTPYYKETAHVIITMKIKRTVKVQGFDFLKNEQDTLNYLLYEIYLK